MRREGLVYMEGRLAGRISEDEHGYCFIYEEEYLQKADARAVSMLLPLCKEAYQDKRLFPFFDGLIPEGWLLDIAEQTWKLDARDRMGLLLACCQDCIGAVCIRPVPEEGV
ncbi:MAG: HipA N-terminal domain-containing protein [Kiritimatiellae bacterium]|nr:HipA N-terminal domain-containing protein [Kiritimatiellia bacterium]